MSTFAPKKFDIIRHFKDSGRKYTVRQGITLEEAQAHCSSADSSSATCTTKVGKDRTRVRGPWFDARQTY